MSEQPKCELCGEPMEELESMFKYHGSLGPCPKPPLPKPVVKTEAERIAEAIASEREACAKIADDCYESASVTHGPCAAAEYIARTIRARGSK
jgi:hypothetical protein